MKRSKLASLSDKPIRKLKRELDALCSEYVRIRDDYTCVMCGVRNPVWTFGDWTSAECGHIISRTNGALRFDLRPDGNLHCQCHRHNTLHGGVQCRFKHSIDQWPYIEWYIKKFGLPRWEQLREEATADGHWSAANLEVRIEETKIALAQLKREKGLPPYR